MINLYKKDSLKNDFIRLPYISDSVYNYLENLEYTSFEEKSEFYFEKNNYFSLLSRLSKIIIFFAIAQKNSGDWAAPG